MTLTDVVALARAGYNVQQINAIISMMNQPAQQPVVQQMQQPAQQPMVQQMQQPAQQPMVQQMQQPSQQPVVQQMQQPGFPFGFMMQPAQMQQPMVQQMQQPAQEDPVLAQLKQLTGAIYQGNIASSQQPAQRSPEDIIASIINPEVKKEG